MNKRHATSYILVALAAASGVGSLQVSCVPSSTPLDGPDATTSVGGDGGSGDGASPCSDGVPYTSFSRFPMEDAPPGYTVDSNNPPRCTNHCGTRDRVGAIQIFEYEALPSGQCSVEGMLCSMAANPMCPCQGTPGGFNTFYCRCAAGQWRCAIINGSRNSTMGCNPAITAASCSDGSSDQ